MSTSGHAYQPVVENYGPSAMGVGVHDGMVIIQFAEPLEFVGMTPEEAVHTAMALMRAATTLKPELAEGLPE